jgi:hypothetical protein
LFGGLRVKLLPFNNLISAVCDLRCADISSFVVGSLGVLVALAFGVAFLPLADVVFLGVVFLGLAIFFSPFGFICNGVKYRCITCLLFRPCFI